jgi:hypothetical protein
MNLDTVMTWIWLVGIGLQGALAAIVLRRKVWQKFPFFAVYFLANLALSCLSYLAAMIHTYWHTYFYLYWSGQCVMLILGLGVVVEIFTHLFTPYAALKKTAVAIFRGAALLLLVCGAVVIFARPHGEKGLSDFFFVTEEVVRLVEVGLVAFLFVSAGLFGLHWRQSEFGIALGIGTYAIADLVMVSLRENFGVRSAYTLNIGIMLAFDVSLLIWMGCLFSPQRAGAYGKETLEEGQTGVPEKGQLEQWNKVLTELIYQ